MNNCRACRYHRTVDGADYCSKIAEKLLGLKGCGEFVEKSPFDIPHCPTCGRTVLDTTHAIHECMPEYIKK